jgi:hypothetical protein
MYQSISASGGATPGGAAESGREANGEALFVTRAKLNCGVHRGKGPSGVRRFTCIGTTAHCSLCQRASCAASLWPSV